VRAQGRVLRPSDGQPPAKVAFIQCVGSRDERLGNLWCSHVCCPYALRAAELMKHHNPEVEITVFYMDIQNTGNNFPAFYEKCKQDLQFVRNIPVDIYPMEDDRLRMRYTTEADGSPVDAEFDLVVLSIGIMPGLDNQRMASLLDIGLDADGFFRSSDSFNRTATTNNGVFLAGTVGGPKTIAASMAHAGQAAYDAMKYLGGGE
jgi:heterodisulfide reductase subunit A